MHIGQGIGFVLVLDEPSSKTPGGVGMNELRVQTTNTYNQSILHNTSLHSQKQKRNEMEVCSN